MQLLDDASETPAERILVQGPKVTRSFEERAAAAKPARAGSDEEQEETYKMAFLTQCLQVRWHSVVRVMRLSGGPSVGLEACRAWPRRTLLIELSARGAGHRAAIARMRFADAHGRAA